MLRKLARRLRVPALAVLALGLLAGPASAATVTAARLDWFAVKVYDSSAPAGTNRTWLGYVTSPAPLANGTATPSDGATGPTVDTTTPMNTGVAWSFPVASGDYEPANGTGTIDFKGVITFSSPAPPDGHGFTISIGNPRIVLNGDRGKLFATGLSSTGPYTYALPVFDLDLSTTSVGLHADGSRTIAGIVPSLATENLVFPANYRAGAGPDRMPNTFGWFNVRVQTAPVAGPKGDKGDAGPRGEQGRPGRTIVFQITRLKRAPFADGKRHSVRLLAVKSRRVVATGTVRKRMLRVRLTGKRTNPLRGVYLLKVAGKPAKRVRL